MSDERGSAVFPPLRAAFLPKGWRFTPSLSAVRVSSLATALAEPDVFFSSFNRVGA